MLPVIFTESEGMPCPGIYKKEDYIMKKILSLVLVAMLVLAGAALAEGKVGVAMPTQDL